MVKTTNRSGRDGLLKDGTSRLAKAGSSRSMPRIVWLGIVVCVVGAVLLFRGQGGGVPTGIGERRSVVTVGGDTAQDPANTPRSGDVDLTAETPAVTPERPAGGAEDAPVEPAPTRAEPAASTDAAPAEPISEPATRPAATPLSGAPAGGVAPAADGGWLVQAGSFGQAENADKAAAALRARGWDARVKVGNTSDGSMIHRVQIGYFASRQQAETFIAQNRTALAGAIAVHR